MRVTKREKNRKMMNNKREKERENEQEREREKETKLGRDGRRVV